jgi:16S rRNA (cytidine1402-2'-O)-methyltransferase
VKRTKTFDASAPASGTEDAPGAVSPSGFVAEPGTLYSVAVPIGNVRDLSLRAADVLSSVDVVAAEDTRIFRDLAREAGLALRAHKIVSYHGHNEEGRSRWLLERLQAGDSVALVSDAGTPGINDPGGVVIEAALGANVRVVSVPGACAAIASLSVSGLRTDRFHYVGFLPRRGGRRGRALDGVAGLPGTLIFYEAPHRILETLKALIDMLGDRRAAVMRNLTKPTESMSRGTLTSIAEQLASADRVRGEFTILVEGAESAPPVLSPQVEALIDRWIGRGAEPAMVRELAQELLHIRREVLYDRVLDARRSP